jgi:hypothetical protein
LNSIHIGGAIMATATTPQRLEHLSPILFNNTPVITTRLLAHVYGCDEKNIRQNFNNNLPRFTEGKHFYRVEGQALRDLKHCVDNIGAVGIPVQTRILTLWTERGAARHAKILDTDNAWDVFELLEENYFGAKSSSQSACLPPTELTPDQRRHLHDVMDAKVSAIPNESRRAAYSEGWTRFNRHFRIAKYEQLPPERFTEALEYLIALKLKTGQRALPATQAALPALPTDLRHRLTEHARACLDFGSEFYARYTKLQAESRALAGDLRQHISATPSFDSSPSGALARERVYDAMTTFARRGGTIVEAGTDNLYMTARLMEGLAGMK